MFAGATQRAAQLALQHLWNPGQSMSARHSSLQPGLKRRAGQVPTLVGTDFTERDGFILHVYIGHR